MFHPVALARQVEEEVVRGDERKYYRFRPARFYGGIATADCVGCCLKCVFCWSWREVAKPSAFGAYHSPGEVAHKLVSIAKSRGYRQVRISGNEPTIGLEHLLRVIEEIPASMRFILETNGILIGAERSYAEALSGHPNVHVRVSLKGASEEEFSRLTGAAPEGFGLQLRALEHLVRSGVRAHPACMVSFSSPEAIESLRQRLQKIDPSFGDFEVEELILYPHVEERLRSLRVDYRTAHSPDAVPPEQI